MAHLHRFLEADRDLLGLAGAEKRAG